MAGIAITVDVRDLEAASKRLQSSLDTINALQQVVRKYAYIAQAQAVLNVSGISVTYSGGSFVIHRQTGRLAQSIQVWHMSGLASVIRATAKYADIIESGVLHPVDMKPFLRGKMIPIKLKGQQGNRFISHPVMTGLGSNGKPAGNSHQGPDTPGIRKIARYGSTGKLVGHDYVIFRKVTPQSKGWIIPPRLPRPFMQAVAEKIEAPFRDEVAEAYARFIEGD